MCSSGSEDDDALTISGGEALGLLSAAVDVDSSVEGMGGEYAGRRRAAAARVR